VNVVELIKLWKLGKQIGITCCGDEQEVVKELKCMEESDPEVVKRYGEGNKNEFL